MTAPAAQPGNWVDPHRSYNFELIIDKVASGHFTEVSGLGVKSSGFRIAKQG